MAKKTEYSNHGWGIGVELPKELLDRLTNATNGKLDNVLTDALYNSSRYFKDDIEGFMDPSKHPKYGTGRTQASMLDEIKNDGKGNIKLTIGYNVTKGQGLPALFFDIGTPTIKPTYFVYYARSNNHDKIKQEQINTVTKFLQGES